MRRLIYTAQVTVNCRIATLEGNPLDRFPRGEEEERFASDLYIGADWIMSRPVHDAMVPWWDAVTAGTLPSPSSAMLEFAQAFSAVRRIVISETMAPCKDLMVLKGNLVPALQGLKQLPGADLIMAVGPRTIGPLLGVPGLIDELALVVHPEISTAGPRLFDDGAVALETISSTAFDSGVIVNRYGVAG